MSLVRAAARWAAGIAAALLVLAAIAAAVILVAKPDAVRRRLMAYATERIRAQGYIFRAGGSALDLARLRLRLRDVSLRPAPGTTGALRSFEAGEIDVRLSWAMLRTRRLEAHSLVVRRPAVELNFPFPRSPTPFRLPDARVGRIVVDDGTARLVGRVGFGTRATFEGLRVRTRQLGRTAENAGTLEMTRGKLEGFGRSAGLGPMAAKFRFDPRRFSVEDFTWTVGGLKLGLRDLLGKIPLLKPDDCVGLSVSCEFRCTSPGEIGLPPEPPSWPERGRIRHRLPRLLGKRGGI